MAKRRRMSKKERDDAAWKALPESDRKCICALIIISRVIGDKNIRYREPSASLQRSLRKHGRNTLYGVIAECLFRLLGAPVIERVKKVHRDRAAKKKKRISAAKKRSSAVKKNSRTKKSAPKRRITTKGPSK